MLYHPLFTSFKKKDFTIVAATIVYNFNKCSYAKINRLYQRCLCLIFMIIRLIDSHLIDLPSVLPCLGLVQFTEYATI